MIDWLVLLTEDVIDWMVFLTGMVIGGLCGYYVGKAIWRRSLFEYAREEAEESLR